jgi:hypothetical protein
MEQHVPRPWVRTTQFTAIGQMRGTQRNAKIKINNFGAAQKVQIGLRSPPLASKAIVENSSSPTVATALSAWLDSFRQKNSQCRRQTRWASPRLHSWR